MSCLPRCWGYLEPFPNKFKAFLYLRLDRIKNLSGLVSWYGGCPRLQEACNLVIVGGITSPEQTDDREEAVSSMS